MPLLKEEYTTPNRGYQQQYSDSMEKTGTSSAYLTRKFGGGSSGLSSGGEEMSRQSVDGKYGVSFGGFRNT